MATDPLEQVLNLVAEGQVSAEEAASILAALDARSDGATAAAAGKTGNTGGTGTSPRDKPPGGFGPNPPPDLDSGGSATALRLEIREGGRQVVNLRLPMAVGRLALDRVPGLSGDQVDRVREALGSGMRGPVLEVDDGDNTVRIILE